RGFHPAHGVKGQWAIDFVSAGLEIDLQCARLSRLWIGRQLLIDALTFDLEGVFFSARVLDHERGLTGFGRGRHVEVIFGHRDIDLLTFLRTNYPERDPNNCNKRNESFHDNKESRVAARASG